MRLRNLKNVVSAAIQSFYTKKLSEFPSFVVSGGKIEWVSDEFASLAGMQPEALVNMKYSEMVAKVFESEVKTDTTIQITTNEQSKRFRVRISEFDFLGSKKVATIFITS